MTHRVGPVILLLLGLAIAVACGGGGGGVVLLASTTTTEDSGLLDVLIPAFEAESGYKVKLISGGSGQALETARRGDVDVLLVHSPAAEMRFVADGDGTERAPVMYNRFILVGPPADPAGARGKPIVDALRAVAGAGAPFVSRGDDSGTHVVERRLWSEAGIDPVGESWYSETGQGQGATLLVASQQHAYALADSSTFTARASTLDLRLMSDRGEGLRNEYHVIVVDPGRHKGVNADGARAWAAFVTGPRGQDIIRAFGVGSFGAPLFTAAADDPSLR